MKEERPASRQAGETKIIEWGEVRRRMDLARAAVERGTTPSADEKRAILKARAKELARELDEAKTAGESIEVLEFLLAHESYGIETSFVREAYSLKELTPVPGAPPFVLGITNMRGEILSVNDIRRFFDLPEVETADKNKFVIIIRDESVEFGIRVDDIVGVRSIPLAKVQPPLPTLTGAGADYLRGVTNERTVILDTEKILSDRKMVVDEEAGK